jgi:hypothetical protein
MAKNPRAFVPLDELIESDDPDKLMREAKYGDDPVSTTDISEFSQLDQVDASSTPSETSVSEFGQLDQVDTQTSVSDFSQLDSNELTNTDMAQSDIQNQMTAEPEFSLENYADATNPVNAYDTNVNRSDETGIQTKTEETTTQENKVQNWDENGNSTGSSSKPDINKDTTALTQTGALSNPGFFGDQSMKNSDVAFNKAVNMCTAVAGFAKNLQKSSPPPNYQRTSANYILTDREKEAIDLKSRELATYGVVPYDILLQFFYILAAIENESDMVHISKVVGIPDLERNYYIRNILGILQIKDIFKIGYLANGVASVINDYADKYSGAKTKANPYNTSFGKVEQARNIAQSFGVLGPIILSAASNLNGNIGILSNAPNLSSAAVSGAIDSALQMASGLDIGSAIGMASDLLSNPTASLGNIASSVGAGAIQGLLSASPLGGVLSQFGGLGALAIGPLLEQTGGLAIGGFMSELITGSRLPTQKIANNPSLRPPSYAGKTFFGETPCALPAVDQLFCRKVGSFGNPSGGSGADSFGMQNFASFGGSMDIASVVTKMVTGSSNALDPTTFFGKHMDEMVGNVCNVLNVAKTASIEMRRSDNAIPFTIGLSAAIAGETFSPFGSKSISDGWKVASSAANDIQRYNPQYLSACRSSL